MADPMSSSLVPSTSPASFSELPLALQRDLIRLDHAVLDDPSARASHYVQSRTMLMDRHTAAAAPVTSAVATDVVFKSSKRRTVVLYDNAAANPNASASTTDASVSATITASDATPDGTSDRMAIPLSPPAAPAAMQSLLGASLTPSVAAKRRSLLDSTARLDANTPGSDYGSGSPYESFSYSQQQQQQQQLHQLQHQHSYSSGHQQQQQQSQALLMSAPLDALEHYTHQQPPTNPRLPAAPLVDPTTRRPLASFPSLPALMAARAAATPTAPAMRVLDAAGTTVAAVTYAELWEKARAMAPHIAKHTGASELPPQFQDGAADMSAASHVVLVYRRSELAELVTALMAVWLAGKTAVPVPLWALMEDHGLELDFILSARPTATRLLLSTDATLRMLHADALARGVAVPAHVEMWDTLSVFPPMAPGTAPALVGLDQTPSPDVPALLDYCWHPAGKLRGVAVPHAALLSQLHAMQLAVPLRSDADVVFTTHEYRGFGAALVLHSLYAGAAVVIGPSPSIVEVGGVWLYLLAQHRVTVTALAPSDVDRLSIIVTAAGAVPSPDELRRLRAVLVDDAVLHPAVLAVAAQKLAPFLRPDQIANLFVPVVAIPELAGLALAFRDAAPDSVAAESVGGVLLDRASLRKGQVVLIDGEPTTQGSPPGAVAASAVGLPAPLASIAIVARSAPRVLEKPNTLGEIYVASPASDGMSFADNNSQHTFGQRPLHVQDDGSMTPSPRVYVRTGLIGALIDGQVLVVVGRVSDILVDMTPLAGRTAIAAGESPSPILHFPSDVTATLSALIKGVTGACLFTVPSSSLPTVAAASTGAHDVPAFLPVFVCETTRSAAELASVATSAIAVMHEVLGLRCFSIMFYSPGTLPRAHGRLIPGLVKRAAASLSPLWASVHTSALPPRTAMPGALMPSPAPAPGPHSAVVQRELPGEIKYRCMADLIAYRASKSSSAEKDAYIALSPEAGGAPKPYTWKKLANKISALASLLTKKGIRAGDHCLLLYTHSIDFVVAVHACIYAGIIAIPTTIPDMMRIEEDVPALVSLCTDLNVQAILCNDPAEEILKSKVFLSAVKRYAASTGGDARVGLPTVHNTESAKSAKTLGADGLRLDDKYLLNRDIPALLQVHYDSEMTRTVTRISHLRLLEMTQALSNNLQLGHATHVLSSVRTQSSLGFLFGVTAGVYCGSTTVLLPPQLFAQSPDLLLDAIPTYGIKAAFMTGPMLEYLAESFPQSLDQVAGVLASLQHLLVARDNGRGSPLQHLALPTAVVALSTAGNCMVTGNPGPLSSAALSLPALRRGFVEFVAPPQSAEDLRRSASSIVQLTSSGSLVPGTTAVIVDPVTGAVMSSNQLGEVLVASTFAADGVLPGMAHGDDFVSGLSGFPPTMAFHRTGQIGFIGDGSQSPSSSSPPHLFSLGRVSDVLRVGPLLHFAHDIEATVTRAHEAIDDAVAFLMPPTKPNDDPTLVVVVEVIPEATCGEDEVTGVTIPMAADGSMPYLCAAPPIVLDVHRVHMLAIDSIVFLAPGMLARSRLLEKQRGKIRDAYFAGVLPAMHTFRTA
ncbi:hypothetical protein BC828DRAFT_402751 [Blastocladiella britannica]|nr:hypothetical protein BC828DRAFT_402751 [Blastocladiella britannica]